MYKDTFKGAAKEAAGVAKKKTGDMIDDPAMEADGAMLEGEGKVQKTVGKAKDAIRDVLKN